MDASVIYQRTHAGRTEIHEKRHGLTQSERLVLIMIDGVTPYADVRKKLPVLRDERFARAFAKLIQQELIVEVFLPVPDQTAENVERSIIDRFLQQDPLDPVTIIVYDIEEEIGETAKAKVSPVENSATITADVEVSEAAPQQALGAAIDAEPLKEPAMDAMHVALADSLSRDFERTRSQRTTRTGNLSAQSLDRSKLSRAKRRKQARAHWPYWSIGIGIAFIAGFVVARMPL